MGKFVDGKWHDIWYDTPENKGHFNRKDAAFRNWITKDGSPGLSGTGGFATECDRYRL